MCGRREHANKRGKMDVARIEEASLRKSLLKKDKIRHLEVIRAAIFTWVQFGAVASNCIQVKMTVQHFKGLKNTA